MYSLASRIARPLLIALALATAPVTGCAQAIDTARTAPSSDTAQLTVTRPTVIAFLVLAEGAVDSLPDLAVAADDWNYAMSILGDSLEARGIGFGLTTRPYLRIAARGPANATLSLGELGTSGFVFVESGMPPCVRRGGMELPAALAAADSILARGAACHPAPPGS